MSYSITSRRKTLKTHSSEGENLKREELLQFTQKHDTVSVQHSGPDGHTEHSELDSVEFITQSGFNTEHTLHTSDVATH